MFIRDGGALLTGLASSVAGYHTSGQERYYWRWRVARCSKFVGEPLADERNTTRGAGANYRSDDEHVAIPAVKIGARTYFWAGLRPTFQTLKECQPMLLSSENKP